MCIEYPPLLKSSLHYDKQICFFPRKCDSSQSSFQLRHGDMILSGGNTPRRHVCRKGGGKGGMSGRWLQTAVRICSIFHNNHCQVITTSSHLFKHRSVYNMYVKILTYLTNYSHYRMQWIKWSVQFANYPGNCVARFDMLNTTFLFIS